MARASPVLITLVVLVIATEARKPGVENGARDGRSIPGVPGQDYPTFAAVPRTGFTCLDRAEGFYADLEARCQVFHICPTPTSRGPGRPQSFLCPNGTLFNARVNTCDWWNKVHCQNVNPDQFYVNTEDHTTPEYHFTQRSNEPFRSYSDELQGDQYISPQTEKVLLDNQVTESRVNFRMNNAYTKTNHKNDLFLGSEYKTPPLERRFISRPESSSPAENRFPSNIDPATEVSIKPRVRYFIKSSQINTKNSLYSLNPIVQVARDSSLLSTFLDPSEEMTMTTDSSSNRIRKPTQRYAIQGVLPQYENVLSKETPISVSSNDDSLESIRGDKNVDLGSNNFKASQNEEGVTVDQTPTSILKPILNIEDEITQTERQLNALFNPEYKNSDPNDEKYLPSNKSFDNVNSSPANVKTDTTGLDQPTFQTGPDSSSHFVKMGTIVVPHMPQSFYSEEDSPQIIRVSSGISFTPSDNANNETPKRFKVSSSYNTQKQQFPISPTETRFDSGVISENSNEAQSAPEIKFPDNNQGGSYSNFGIVDNEEVKFVNKFIATESDIPKTSPPMEDTNKLNIDNVNNTDLSQAFDLPTEFQSPSSSSELADNDPLSAFFPGSVITSSINSPASSTESDLESELISLFGGSTTNNKESDVQNSSVGTDQELTKETNSSSFQFNQSITDSSIANNNSIVVQADLETSTLPIITNNMSIKGKSPEIVDGALNFNFKFDQTTGRMNANESVQKGDEEQIYYGQVTPLNGVSEQNNRQSTLKPSDQAYFTSPKIQGHYITNAPIDRNTLRFQTNRTYQTSEQQTPEQTPQTIEGQYQFLGGDLTTQRPFVSFTPLTSNGLQEINENNYPNLPGTVNRQYIPPYNYYQSFGGYNILQPLNGGNYQYNTVTRNGYNSNYHRAPTTPLPSTNAQENYSTVNDAGYRLSTPQLGSTLNPTTLPPITMYQGHVGNYNQRVLGNAFFLGQKPAFENSHLAFPVFPPQSIFYSNYPDFRVTPKQTTITRTSQPQPPTTYSQPSQTNYDNVPNVNPNFETIIQESIGSIGYQGTNSRIDSTTASSPSVLDVHTNSKNVSISPGSTTSDVQPTVESYPSTVGLPQGLNGQFGSSTSKPFLSNTNQNSFTSFSPAQDIPRFESTIRPSTNNLVGFSQPPEPNSAVSSSYPDGQTNPYGFSPLSSSTPRNSQTSNSIGPTTVSDVNFETSTFRIVYPSEENGISTPSPSVPGLIGTYSTAKGALDKSTFRIMYPSNENELSTPLPPTQEDTSGSRRNSVSTTTSSSLGDKVSFISTERNENTNTFRAPADLTFATPTPFSPLGPRQQYLPPHLHPKILPHYYQAGQQLFTPMDLFDINNLPRPTGFTISQHSSSDIVRSISFSFDNSDEREEFEKARAKGWFDR